MPSGKVHDAMTVGAAAIAAPVWWFAGPEPRTPAVGAALVGCILFSGLMLSPDLDLNSRVFHRWGPLKFLWYPYQRLVPHRSWISHSWLLGPALRLAYFLALIWGMAHVVAWGAVQAAPAQSASALTVRSPVDLVRDLYTHYPQPALYGLLGILIGTGLHTSADAVWSFVKRRL